MPVHRLGADVATLGARFRGALLAVLATVSVSVSYEFVREGLALPALLAVVVFYGGTAGIIIAFSLWTAPDVGLPGLLSLADEPIGHRLMRWCVFGLGLGLLLAGGSVALSGGADTPLQPWFWRRIQTPGGAALFSARAALLEETFFRLFLIPFLASVALRMRPRRHRLRLREGTAQAVIDRPVASPVLIAVVVLVSSLMFGVVHPFNPVGAVLLGPLLAVAYLWGGWESAVTAHFLANMILFQFYY